MHPPRRDTVTEMGCDVARDAAAPLEPATPRRCIDGVAAVGRLLALMPVVFAIGCAGAKGGHDGPARHPHRSPVSTSAPPVAGVGVFPPQLRGVALTEPSGLELVVSADPPYLLDVDTGKVTTVEGLGVSGPGPVLSVSPAGRNAIVWVDRHPLTSASRQTDIYVLRPGATTATRLASGSEVQPTADSRALWVGSYRDRRHCALREVDLTGGQLRAPRRVSCRDELIDAGSGALLVQGSAVIDPASGRVLLHTHFLWAIAGNLALTVGRPLRPLTLIDLSSGARHELRWPSRLGGPQSGADQAAVDPSGRLIALSFSDPAYRLTGVQVIDVWLLDPRTGRWQHLPGMPADAALKLTSMTWTGDGRLVMLAATPTRGPASHEVVAVWRPGEKRLAVRSVHIPARDSGSDSFAVWTRPTA